MFFLHLKPTSLPSAALGNGLSGPLGIIVIKGRANTLLLRAELGGQLENLVSIENRARCGHHQLKSLGGEVPATNHLLNVLPLAILSALFARPGTSRRAIGKTSTGEARHGRYGHVTHGARVTHEKTAGVLVLATNKAADTFQTVGAVVKLPTIVVVFLLILEGVIVLVAGLALLHHLVALTLGTDAILVGIHGLVAAPAVGNGQTIGRRHNE